ncbi:DegT/DnrJ/EryC1/StrS family aminotransferase [Rhodanobacter sp. DHB23]|uniref:DegT/DnrJ/EryC1/StrS family aminotransferase n=1 Tax=Rhodanobacter sp. DHB23 TaxID=2775923 RepID=UPI00177DA40B|nr:DegT/DnrJ/EryC1/StrS family aminotransferase [Rhodanobacter sp. DHB23]MBD8873121.1 DegT/DnrJ/EryC1/StrS family aminotransferase [Rhodanobacter sp. DHB23]
MIRIPVYQPDLSGNERRYVLECLESTWVSSKGHFIQDFEATFAKFVGAPHASSACNGTVALHLALLALGIGPGDEVLVPSFTYVASVNAIQYVGATPVFCDSLPDTWQLDPADVERRITSRTRAIMAVHLYGGACDMPRYVELCERHSLKLVEDCAEAIGTRLNDRHVGTFGDIATFSFFGNKTITTGEGGMVVCNDHELNARVRHLRGQGLAENREYWHDIIGYNYRMTNICAAMGLAQLERIDDILLRKSNLASAYHSLLKGCNVSLQEATKGEISSHWMVTVLAPDKNQRDRVRAALREHGIETRPAFHPVHTMPMYFTEAQLPVAQDLGARGINLPSWHNLPMREVENICKVIIDICTPTAPADSMS